MEQDNHPENQGAGTPQTAEDALRAVTQELQSLKDNLLSQFNEELAQMKAERARLDAELEQMRSQYQQMQSQQPDALPQTPQAEQPQTEQQQVWTQQLAQILANHLQERLKQQLSQYTGETPQAPPTPTSDSNENTYRLLSSVDSTLSTSLKALQQDVSSYQSALAQQLGRMQTMEQQAEAILEALVNRLKYQLRDAAVVEPPVLEPPQQQSTSQRRTEAPASRTVTVETSPKPAALPPAPSVSPSAFRTGLLLILLSSLTLSLQNVVTRIILQKKTVFLLGKMGGFLAPTPGNSLLILLMRMVIVLPLMFFVARMLYPRAWRDLMQLFLSRSKRNSLGWIIGSGASLFLSQFFMYIALGNIPTGVGTTIFFIYPTVTILLAWKFFGSRPSYSLSLATLTIYLGVFLSIPFGQTAKQGNLWLGVGTAVAAGLTFAGYVLLTQICAQKLKLHPAPFTVVNFATMLVLSALSLGIANLSPLKEFRYSVPANMWDPLWMATGILALTTLVGYLLNNFGVPMIGAALAAIVGATSPALTTLIAWGLIGENLIPIQLIGIALVTLWVLGISLENMQKMAAKKPSIANR